MSKDMDTATEADKHILADKSLLEQREILTLSRILKRAVVDTCGRGWPEVALTVLRTGRVRVKTPPPSNTETLLKIIQDFHDHYDYDDMAKLAEYLDELQVDASKTAANTELTAEGAASFGSEQQQGAKLCKCK
jgi:hypothetical protein